MKTLFRSSSALEPITKWGIGALLALVVKTGAAADFPTTVVSLNPIGYWRFNEATPSPAPPMITNSSTLGAVGTGFVVDATQGEPGIVGNCIRFYNSSANQNVCTSKVDVAYAPNFNPDAPFSVEFWAKPNSLYEDLFGGSPVSSITSSFYTYNRSGYLFGCNSAGVWNFRIGGENGYTAQVLAKSGRATIGTWQYVVGIFDGTNATLYVDGQNVGTSATLAGVPFEVNRWAPMRFGGTAMTATTNPDFGGNRGWDGWVDEVAVYARVLGTNTIAAHFHAASTNNSGYHKQILADNPVGYWGMDEPVYTAPDPGTYPTAANTGTLGPAAVGTNTPGVLAAQNGSTYAGLEGSNLACTFNGAIGGVTLSNPDTLSNLVGQITLMAWVKPTAAGGLQDIISHGYDDNFVETYLRIGDAYDWEGLGEPDTAYYEVGATADGFNYNTALFPVPSGDIGNWVFLVGTWDGTNWNLYRNGQLVAQAPDVNGPAAVTNAWAIGSRGEPSDFFGMYFSGSIDEAAIFTNALSSSTVRALYESASVPPVLTQSPQLPPGQVYGGDLLVLNALAEGNPVLAYQWTRNGTNLIGQNSPTFTLNPVSTNDGGTYSVIVTNNYGSATGSVFFAVAHSAPIILAQPAPQERWDTVPFAFSVAVTGSKPLSYQWTLSGTNLNGANASSYYGIASTTTAGDYTCVLSNSYGATTTTVATLSVMAIPTGYAATVLADMPIAYFRLDETNGSVAHDAVGGNDGTYFNITFGQPGYCVVDPDPAIEVNGQDSYVGNISGTAINFEGTNSSFSLELWVNGSADQLGDATLIAKGLGSLYDNPNEQFCIDISERDYRFFSRAATGDSAQVPNSQALASIGPDGAWHHMVGVYDSQASELYLYVDGQLAAQASGPLGGPLPSRQPVSIGSKRSGVTTIYDLPFTGSLDEVAIYNKALSPAQVLAHFQAACPDLKPIVTTQPISMTNFVTLNASFQIDASGTAPLFYAWTKDGVGLSDNGGISGSTTHSLSITGLDLTNAGGYACVVTNPLGSVTSKVANLTVLWPPTLPPCIPGLVLHLPFDGNLEDVTGRGNNGTAVGSPTFVPDGVVLGRQALHYITSTSNNLSGNTVTEADYVTLGVRPDLQFGSNISFTVAYWVRLPLNYIGGDLPFFTDATNSTMNPGFTFSPSYGQTALTGNAQAWSGGWAMSIFDADLSGVGVYGDIGSINDGNWHHLVHVVDRSRGAVTYLDGVRAHDTLKAGRSAATAGNIDTGAPANIGQDPTGQYSEPGSADIEDLGVWHRALSPLEAASIYMAGISNRLSFCGAPIILTEQQSTNQIILSWPGGMLQSADSVTGPFTNVTPVSPLNLTPSADQQFFRVHL